MHVEINISDEEIAFAEKILLPVGKKFDAERRAFIRNLDTLDLQAVPGSGKTTALLAKLIILERYLPFDDGSAVLVISHTNSAVDEIRKKIGSYCPHLFSYPNCISTIQEFVDRFLAIPYYVTRQGGRPTRIDNQAYEDAVSRFIGFSVRGFKAEEQRRGRHFLIGNKCMSTYRLSVSGSDVKLTKTVCGDELTVYKPKGNTGKDKYSDWSAEEQRRVKSWLKAFKMNILERGVLCYDDAYFLAARYLSRIPQSKRLLQCRFKFVFVDEMQDMGKHQYELLEDLFFDFGKSPSRYQRIGDRNQAIFDGHDCELETAWQAREPLLSLANSCRLSGPTARVAEPFAVYRQSEFKITGLGVADIKPHFIVYDDESLEGVVPRFSTLVNELIQCGRIPVAKENVYAAVAWNSEWSNKDDKSNPDKVRLVDYFSLFQRANQNHPIDHDALDGYLRYFDSKVMTLNAARLSILNAFLKVLRLEDVQDPRRGKNFTSAALLAYVKEVDIDIYEEFKLRLFQWSLSAVKNQTLLAENKMRGMVPTLLALFERKISKSRTFLDKAETTIGAQGEPREYRSNNVNLDGFEIELATVHAVKGRTHTATLYLESYFNRLYESQSLCSQLLLAPLTGKEKDQVKQAAKMVYVGFSRPTHLLCFAVHKKRFEKHLADVDRRVWQVIRFDEEVAMTS